MESQVLESFRVKNRASRRSGSARTIIRNETNSRNCGKSFRVEETPFSLALGAHNKSVIKTIALNPFLAVSIPETRFGGLQFRKHIHRFAE